MAVSKVCLSFLAGLGLLFCQINKAQESTNKFFNEPARFEYEIWNKILLEPKREFIKKIINPEDLFPRAYDITLTLVKEGNLDEALYFLQDADLKDSEKSNSRNFEERMFLGDSFQSYGDQIRFEGQIYLSNKAYEIALLNYKKAQPIMVNNDFDPIDLYLAKKQEAIGDVFLKLDKKEEAKLAFQETIHHLRFFGDPTSCKVKRDLENLLKKLR
jgi:tetratricopeptide (TPR) repeat protein